MIKNLLYFIYPVEGSMLHFNLNRLSRYLGHFNGRRIILAVQDHDTLNEIELRHILNLHGLSNYELVFRPNDPEKWESPHFRTLLGMVESKNQDEISFYAHAKGTSLVFLRGEGYQFKSS